MRIYSWAIAVAVVCASATLSAQSKPERFGIGTFTYQGRTFAGLVLRVPNEVFGKPGFVADLGPAAAAAKQSGIPNNVLGIIDEWNDGVEAKVNAVAMYLQTRLDKDRPPYVYSYSAVIVDRPFMPVESIYAFSNYPNVTASEKPKPIPPAMPGLWNRPPDNPKWVASDGTDSRPQNPFGFLMPAGAPYEFSADNEPILIYNQRSDVEYECELAAVLGKQARRVPPDQLKSGNYIFGYMNTNHVSDRQSRKPDPVAGDWLSQKGFDGFTPIGPFIVPAEFVDPENEDVEFDLTDAAGAVHKLQTGNTGNAYHSVYDFISWASNIETLPAGFVFGLGTPPGSHGGLGRFMVPGDVNQCSYTGLGTLTNTVYKETPELDQKLDEDLSRHPPVH